MINTTLHARQQEAFEQLREELLELRARVTGSAETDLCSLSADEQASRLNLHHYLNLRSTDLRRLQERLSELGLASLGHCESHVLHDLDRVLQLVHAVLGEPAPDLADAPAPPVDPCNAARILEANTTQVLGPAPSNRAVRIMVTMPSEAAEDAGLVRALLGLGMDVARINCAHDGPEQWLAMIAKLRAEAAALGRSLRIAADLPGHKVRTTALASEPGVVHLRPQRDRIGRVVTPARFAASLGTSAAVESALPVTLTLRTAQAEPPILFEGDVLEFTDARGARRQAMVEQVDERVVWLSLGKSSYLVKGLKWRTRARKETLEGWFDDIPDEPVSIRLRRTDRLVLVHGDVPGRPARRDADGMPVEPARIGCSLPEVFDAVRVDQRVWIDDGKFGGIVREVRDGEIEIEITDCRPGGALLKEDKGLNFPGMEMSLPALCKEDYAALDVLAGKVDVFNFSFVETAEHIVALDEALRARSAQNTPVIAKIETARAFNNLSRIVLASLGRFPLGVMIARGDLAMEVGPERMAEVQEEILWLSEAAHLPVVWATQVLETLAKKGVVSRPEMTDAAMGERAECVMLNKGPFIEKAMHSLDDILVRMSAHQHKKAARMRALTWGRCSKPDPD
ncbi:MAG: pyruvate kinase [Halothiobacillaceae bacterium]